MKKGNKNGHTKGPNYILFMYVCSLIEKQSIIKPNKILTKCIFLDWKQKNGGLRGG